MDSGQCVRMVDKACTGAYGDCVRRGWGGGGVGVVL